MTPRSPSEEYTYWKRPSQKWVTLIIALTQFLNLWQEIQEYRFLQSANIFSDAAWQLQTIHHHMHCALTALCAILLLGTFLIGVLCRSRQAVKTAETALFLSMTVLWAVSGFLLDFPSQLQTCGLWVVILLFLTGGCLYTLLKKPKG